MCKNYLGLSGSINVYQVVTGGAEHAVLHLLYARFWHKVLYDLGVVSTKEPFQRLVSQGMILGEVGRAFLSVVLHEAALHSAPAVYTAGT